MKLPESLTDTFSPYLDLDPLADFFEDLGQRAVTVFGTAVGIHLALFFLLQPNFVMPDLKPDEPEAIPVQIIAYEDLVAEPERAPEEIEVRPVAPTPASPPPPRPQPQPAPPPAPAPPPPPPAPVIEPEPEFIPPPPAPEILAQEIPEPEAVPLPAEMAPLPEPIPVPEPLPQPIIEIFEPTPPEPVIEPAQQEPQPSEWRPYVPPEPIPEPVIEPEIIIEAPAPPDPQPGEWRPYIPPEPDPIPEPIIETPEPEVVTEEPLPELPDLEEIPQLPTPPQPEVVIEDPPPPEIIPRDEAPIVTTAPTILASPEAPTNAQEAEQAVPQSQSNPMNDFLFRGGKRPGGTPSTGLGKPSTGLGAPSGGRPVASGTSRSNPGASGWTLAPSGTADLGAGYQGLTLDVKCREAGKSHLDCPEYLRTYQGRNRSGWESVGAHSSPAIGSGSSRAGTGGTPAAGTRDIWGSGPHSRPAAIGSNSQNAGGPSTTVMDDADFGREFLGTNLGGSGSGNRLRDAFKGPDEPWQEEILTLPAPDPLDEDE